MIPAAGAQTMPLPGAPIGVGSGEKPNILVDQIGTAHVVYNSDGGPNQPDITNYCRVPRGEKLCRDAKQFVPPVQPSFGNEDFAGPRIVQTSPDEIVVLTRRGPGVTVSEDPSGRVNPRCYEEHPTDFAVACYGSSGNNTWAYVTHDGGAFFSEEHLLGTGRLSGPPAVLTKGFGAPRIAMISDTETGGSYFQAVKPDGWSKTEAVVGDDGPDRALSGSIGVINGALPIVAHADTSFNIFLRGYRSGEMNSSASWGPSARVSEQGTEPRLASGPRGAYLMYRPERTGPNGAQYVIRRVVDKTGRTSATAQPVSDTGGISGRDFFQDAGGGMHAAWVLGRGVTSSQLRYRYAENPTNWSPIQTLTTVAGPTQLRSVDVGAADDGGGFAVWAESPQTGSNNGAIRVVPFGSQTPLVDVRVTGVEVTQAVHPIELERREARDPEAPVAYAGALLARGKQTVVRVYANSRGPMPSGSGVPVVGLRAFRGRTELGTGSLVKPPILPESSPTSLGTGGPAAVPLVDRTNPMGAYTFTVPWNWTADPSITLIAEINPPGVMPAVGECETCRADNRFTMTAVNFRRTTTVIVHAIHLRVNGVNVPGFPDLSSNFAALQAVSPLYIDVQQNGAFYDASYIENEPDWDRNEKGAEAREIVEDWSEDNLNELSSRFPIGLFPRPPATIGGQTNADGELYGDTQPQAVAGSDRPLTSIAHEVLHGLGKDHAGQDCPGTRVGDDQEGEPWEGANQGSMYAIGLDRRTPSPYRIVANNLKDQPPTIFDLMSYCSSGGDLEASHWISVRNWNYQVLFRAPPQRLATALPVPRIRPATTAQASTLRVVAFATPRRTRISSVAPDAGGVTPLGGPYVLIARDAAGREIARAGVEVERLPDSEGVVRLAGRVSSANANSVSIETAGAAVSRTRSANAPRVSVTAPRANARVGGTPTVTVSWAATDADAGSKLRAAVEYSRDGGRTWATIFYGASTGSAKIDRHAFPTSSNARLRVRVNDGFNETVAQSARFRSVGVAPLVSIISPTAGMRLAGGAVLALEGEARDENSRTLTGSSLQWFDGARRIGTGGKLTVGGLAPGRRRIVLEARDARGRRARRTLIVQVTAVKPLFKTLQAPARLGRGARTLKLTVASSVPATLTAGGSRFPVGPRATTVSVPVRAGRSTLRLALKLSSGGKTSSTTVVVPRR